MRCTGAADDANFEIIVAWRRPRYRCRYLTEANPHMQNTLPPLLTLAFVAGCFQAQPAPPVFVPPRAAIEIYATSPNPGPNTKSEIGPTSGSTINLVSPPIITNSDIAGVARSLMVVETVGGTSRSQSIPTLEVKLNATGTPKMLTATTNPASPTIAVAVNGAVLAVPNILTPINGSFRITGDHTDPAFLNAISSATGQSE